MGVGFAHHRYHQDPEPHEMARTGIRIRGGSQMIPRVLSWVAIIAIAPAFVSSWPIPNAKGAEDEIGLIAGLRPHERPAEAPEIKEMTKPGSWYARSLTGLSEPYPSSFRFLEDQENWYSPFNRPGMTGPYDLRGWHRETAGTGN